MPVEIKELSIKAVINSGDETISSANNNASKEEFEKLKKEIKRELLEELKQFLNQYKER